MVDENKEIEDLSIQVEKNVFEIPEKLEPLEKIIEEESEVEDKEPVFQDQKDLKASVKNEVENYLSSQNKPTPKTPEKIISSTTPTPNIEQPSIQSPIIGNVEKISKPANNIRTFRDDIENTIKANKTSVVDIAVAENEKRNRGFNQTIEKESSKNKIFIIIGIVVAVILGIGAVVAGYLLSQQNKPVETPIAVSFQINVNNKKEIAFNNISADSARAVIGNEIKKGSIPLDNILGLYFTRTGDDGVKNLLDISAFLNSIGSTAPAALVRVLEPNFTFGIHAYDGNNPFLILKTSFYQGAYAGLLSWEENIVNDMNGWFINFNPSSEIVAGNSDQILKQGYQFADEVIKNKDVRVLRDSSGKIVLLYSIIDQQTIIITTSENTFKEIVNRLIAMKLIR